MKASIRLLANEYCLLEGDTITLSITNRNHYQDHHPQMAFSFQAAA
jgi:environmental stress-induced protein Ves